ncbi:MAG: hypothetical protein FWG65_10215 [Turicibacter sp.]|nr:hypothetical protein [Turicibacter sp.]
MKKVPVKCPVCGEFEFEYRDDFDICEVCEWGNDSLQQDDPTFPGGLNVVSLNHARQNWQKYRTTITDEELAIFRLYDEKTALKQKLTAEEQAAFKSVFW